MALTPLEELDRLRRRLDEAERWADTPVRDVAVRFLREQLTTFARELRSPEFLRALQAYAGLTRPPFSK
jgi:hypothetical protein